MRNSTYEQQQHDHEGHMAHWTVNKILKATYYGSFILDGILFLFSFFANEMKIKYSISKTFFKQGFT